MQIRNRRLFILFTLLVLMVLAACTPAYTGPTNIDVEVRPDPIVGEVVTMYITARVPEDTSPSYDQFVRYYKLRIGAPAEIEILSARLTTAGTTEDLTVPDRESEIRPFYRDDIHVSTIVELWTRVPDGIEVTAEIEIRVNRAGSYGVDIQLQPYSETGLYDNLDDYNLWITSSETSGEAINRWLLPTRPVSVEAFEDDITRTADPNYTPAPSITPSPVLVRPTATDVVVMPSRTPAPSETLPVIIGTPEPAP